MSLIVQLVSNEALGIEEHLRVVEYEVAKVVCIPGAHVVAVIRLQFLIEGLSNIFIVGSQIHAHFGFGTLRSGILFSDFVAHGALESIVSHTVIVYGIAQFIPEIGSDKIVIVFVLFDILVSFNKAVTS